jgi:hypothetical protein
MNGCSGHVTSTGNANASAPLLYATDATCKTGEDSSDDQEDEMSDIVEIAKFSGEFEAQVAKAHLESEGITANMVTDDGGGAFPNLSMLTGGVRLVVRAEDAEEAMVALKLLGEQDIDDEPEIDDQEASE